MSTEITLALKTKVAYLLPEPELKSVILDNINYAIAYISYKKTAEEKVFEVTELAKEIQTSFKTLRIDEIKVAFKNGLNNEYGDFFGLNVKTYVQWIKSYLSSEKRHLSLKNEHIMQLPEKIITKEEKEKIFNEALEFSKAHFKKYGIILDQGNAIFDGCRKRNLIILTPEQISEAKENSLFEISGEINQRINQPCNSREDYIAKKKLEEQIENLTIESKEVTTHAKNELLKQYYKTLNFSDL